MYQVQPLIKSAPDHVIHVELDTTTALLNNTPLLGQGNGRYRLAIISKELQRNLNQGLLAISPITRPEQSEMWTHAVPN